MNILLAEDEVIARELLASIVTNAGHRVHAVDDGAEAWQVFEGGDYDLVIVDWLMPGMTGLEVTERIRRSPRGDTTFVLMVTGRDSAADLIGALDGGVDDYLIKPVTPDAMLARLVIAERRLQLSRDRKRTQEELERAQRLAAIGDMRVAIQHEINNPLASLMANVQLAQMTQDVGELKEHIAIIDEQAHRIADVVKRLRSLQEPRVVEYLPGSKMIDLSGSEESRSY